MSNAGPTIIINVFLCLLLPLATCAQEAKPEKSMEQKEEIARLYEQMYRAMIAKDTTPLDSLLDADFVLVHMTGMRQSKRQYLEAIGNGTLNYFSAETERLDIAIDGNCATLDGRSCVLAAVFGGGKHTWPLRLRFTLRRDKGRWLFTTAQASTY